MLSYRKPMQYRSAIDGLRAIAVLPVILFHGVTGFLPGGFIGVDVFFVISGYLITSILINDLESNSFSIVNFYERRIRRILPALFFIVICTLPIAWVWMLPFQFRDFGWSLIGVSTFSYNIFEWRDSGYFQANSQLKPLLHTWSLAVEEQYYILFPIFLSVFWKFGKKICFFFICMALIFSFIICVWGSQNYPVANFYLLPFRAWEILAGAVCAFWLSDRDMVENQALSALGLIAICCSIVLFDEKTPFPSQFTLLPVMGTCLVILFAGTKDMAGRLLSTPILVGIGLISYSAYLWHFPLFALARIRSLHEPTPTVMLMLTVLTLILATFSWRFVERPFRQHNGNFFRDRRLLFITAALSTMCVMLVGFVIVGTPEPEYKTAMQNLVAPEKANHGLHPKCSNGFSLDRHCRTSEDPEIVLWGDSFAMHLAGGLVASEPGLAFQQLTSVGCPPIQNLRSSNIYPVYSEKFAEECDEFNTKVIGWLSEKSSVRYVVISSRFTLIEYIPDFDLGNGPGRKTADRLVMNFKDTIDKIRSMGIKVVLFTPPPENGQDLGLCYAKAVYHNEDINACNFDIEESNISRENLVFINELKKIVPYIEMSNMVCPDGHCRIVRDGVLLFRDYGHLSNRGSNFLGENYGWARLVRQTAQ